MLSSDNQLAVMILPTTAQSAAGLQFGTVDCKGFHFLDIDVVMQSMSSTSNIPTVLKLGETDDTTAHTVTSDMTDIAAFLGGTAFTIPVTTAASGYTVKFRVDLRQRQRYIGLSVTCPPTWTQQICAIANLSGAEEGVDATNSRMIGLIAG